MTHYEKALQYVRENQPWTASEEDAALDIINRYRCNIEQASPSIADEICDLMEEYGEENDLPEGWWYDYGDIDDVFFKLGDSTTPVDRDRLLMETIAVLSADVYGIIYNPEEGMGWSETAAKVIQMAEQFEQEMDWKPNDERDFIDELEKFERRILK